MLTLLGVGIGLVMRPALGQRRAVAAIESVGGQVAYHESTWLPRRPFLRNVLIAALPTDCCYGVDIVSFDHRTGWNKDLPRHFAELTSVDTLDLLDTEIMDSDLEYLQRLSRLEGLNLSNTSVTDAGLAHLKSLTHLRAIVLYKTQVTDAGLAYMQGLSSLEILELQGTHVTDAGLVHLKELTNLNWLDLSGTGVTDAGLTHLQQMPNLDTVIVDATQVTEEGRDAFLQALPVHRAQAAAQAQLEERRRAAQSSSRDNAE